MHLDEVVLDVGVAILLEVTFLPEEYDCTKNTTGYSEAEQGVPLPRLFGYTVYDLAHRRLSRVRSCYTIHVGDACIKLNPETKEPNASRHDIDIMTGGGMPFAAGAHPEYEAFYNGSPDSRKRRSSVSAAHTPR